MLITTLRIQGYRNLAVLTLNFESDVTIIIGANNSGKTNLLDALYAALRVNRTVRQGAFQLHDYHLAKKTSMAGDAGPIELSVTFAELAPNEWSEDVVSQFNEVRSIDLAANLNSVTLRVRSTAPADGKDEEYSWSFINNQGQPFTGRRFFTELSVLQKVRPLFQLGALRDAAREFTRRSPFFAPFVTDPSFDEALRVDLTRSLGEINEKVVAAHGAFETLRDNIASGTRVVGGFDGDVLIEAVPTRLSELLENTQVSLASRAGPTMPLDRHGSGTQSMAVLSLFSAYVHSKLQAQLDPESRAILTLEEPESHLHPSAIQLLWNLVRRIDAQLILTTHSGELLSAVPLRCIRRIAQTSLGVRVYNIDESAFDGDELRHINYGVRLSRGELFFANAWLLVEGRTEVIGLARMAELMRLDLTSHGVSIVECQQYGGVEPFLKLADQLGIAWHCLCDGDEAGQKNVETARRYLNDRVEMDHITAMTVRNIEAFLCLHGFADIYMRHVAEQKLEGITATAGTEAHANQVSRAIIKSHKERAILEVCAAIEMDETRAPAAVREILTRCCTISRV